MWRPSRCPRCHAAAYLLSLHPPTQHHSRTLVHIAWTPVALQLPQLAQPAGVQGSWCVHPASMSMTAAVWCGPYSPAVITGVTPPGCCTAAVWVANQPVALPLSGSVGLIWLIFHWLFTGRCLGSWFMVIASHHHRSPPSQSQGSPVPCGTMRINCCIVVVHQHCITNPVEATRFCGGLETVWRSGRPHPQCWGDDHLGWWTCPSNGVEDALSKACDAPTATPVLYQNCMCMCMCSELHLKAANHFIFDSLSCHLAPSPVSHLLFNTWC